MQWLELHPGCMDTVEVEINEAVGALHKLEHSLASVQKRNNVLQQSQSSSSSIINASQKKCVKIRSAINALIEAMQRRVHELREFYDSHDMDPRAETAERCRLLLKKKLLERGVTVPCTNGNPVSVTVVNETPIDNNYGCNNTPIRQLSSSVVEESGRYATTGNTTPSHPSKNMKSSDCSAIKVKVILSQEEYFEILRRRLAISEMQRS